MKINLKTMLLKLTITALLGSLLMNAGILHDAVDTGNLEKVKTVFEHDKSIDIDELENDNSGFTAVHKAFFLNYLEIATYLIGCGADINKTDESSNTPLHWAEYSNNLEMATYLIGCGADINKANRFGTTPLNAAAQFNKLQIATHLIIYGADTNKADVSSNTPLLWATKKNNLKMVQYLIIYGANINKADKLGDTALHWAAYENHLDIVKYLVEHGGADITLKNNKKKTAFDRTYKQKIREYLTHVKNYFDNLILVTETDIVNGNPIDPITIPNYNTLNLLPLVAKKKMQISLFNNERIKKEFHNTHFLYL